MTVLVKNLVPGKTVENVQTTQYTATNVTTIIDKFTATNYSATAATISVNLVTTAGSAGDINLITKTKTLQPSEVLSRSGNASSICSRNWIADWESLGFIQVAEPLHRL